MQTVIQRSYYLDAGISKGGIKSTRIGYVSYDLSVVGSIFPSFRKETPSIYGIKCSADFGANGGVLGMELGWYVGKPGQAVIVTPKIGFGLSLANVSYGYGFAVGSTPLTRIGGHMMVLQLSAPLQIKHK